MDRVSSQSRLRFGVVGFPVKHSRSPQMHRAVYQALTIDAEYLRLPIPPALFEETVRALPGSGFSGVNVTIPYKEAALALADHVSDSAGQIGAANTLTFERGEIFADNTDAPGLIAALPVTPARTRALVLGAGGTGRAAVWALANSGAEVSVWNRTPDRARELANQFAAGFVDHPQVAVSDADLVINCTAVGLDPELGDGESLAALGIDERDLRVGMTVVDFVYAAEPTALIRVAELAGARTVTGRELLVRQGALSFTRWFGQEPPLEVMRSAIA